MRTIYLLLFAMLLYTFFGRIVDIFIASNTSSRLLNIKAKIFFYTFVAPIIFSTAFFVVVFTHNKTFNIFYGIVLTLASILRIYFFRRRYLTEFRIDNKKLNITYLTHFLKPYSIKFNLIDITDFEMTKANWLAEYPTTINVRHKEEWTTFEIINKKLKAEVKSDTEAANICISKSGAEE